MLSRVRQGAARPFGTAASALGEATLERREVPPNNVEIVFEKVLFFRGQNLLGELRARRAHEHDEDTQSRVPPHGARRTRSVRRRRRGLVVS